MNRRPDPAVFLLAAQVLEDLPGWLTVTRHDTGLSLRQVGAQAGVSYYTVSRAESGRPVYGWVAAKLLRWLGETRA